MTNQELEALERRISELKVLYDNYFAGVEKREPLPKREALLNDMRRLTANPGQLNTQTQFRFNNIRARFATMEAHWNRIVRNIEEGTAKRPVAARAGADSPPPPPRAPASAPPPSGPNPLAEQTMRQLYDNYAASRKATGEPAISFDAMVTSLKKQVPAVIDRYKCKSVEFKVAQKDGKTIIKAVPIA